MTIIFFVTLLRPTKAFRKRHGNFTASVSNTSRWTQRSWLLSSTAFVHRLMATINLLTSPPLIQHHWSQPFVKHRHEAQATAYWDLPWKSPHKNKCMITKLITSQWELNTPYRSTTAGSFMAYTKVSPSTSSRKTRTPDILAQEHRIC